MLFDYPIKCKKVKIWQLMKALRVGEKQCGYSYTLLSPCTAFFQAFKAVLLGKLKRAQNPGYPPSMILKRNLRFPKSPEAKVRCKGPLGTARAQPWPSISVRTWYECEEWKMVGAVWGYKLLWKVMHEIPLLKKIMITVTSYYQKTVRLMTAWLVYQKAEETETKW